MQTCASAYNEIRDLQRRQNSRMWHIPLVSLLGRHLFYRFSSWAQSSGEQSINQSINHYAFDSIVSIAYGYKKLKTQV